MQVSFLLSILYEKQVVYGHFPAGDGRLGFCNLALVVHSRLAGTGRTVHAHDVFAEYVHVPDDLSASGEVIFDFVLYLALGSGAVTVRVSELSGEDRSAFRETHRHLACVEGKVRAERFAMR